MTQADDITENQQKLLKTFRGEFVKITPGKGKFPKSFEMGSDSATQSPVHKVTFDYSFSVAKYEVPQNLWEAVMGSNPSRWKGPRNSVEELSFADAESFCKKATQMMQQLNLIEKNESIRLPSESEWEYFARAGTTTAYSFGDDVKQLTDYGWFTGNAAGNDPPVGVKNQTPGGSMISMDTFGSGVPIPAANPIKTLRLMAVPESIQNQKCVFYVVEAGKTRLTN